MLKEQAGKSAEVLPRADREALEPRHCEVVREVFQTIDKSGSGKLTYLFIDSLWNELSAALHELEHLPEAAFKELIEVIKLLGEARDELRLARFLFDVEEINSVHRLIMRNRAVFRGRELLRRVLRVWPLQFPSPGP
jgi:hypothetical protein